MNFCKSPCGIWLLCLKTAVLVQLGTFVSSQKPTYQLSSQHQKYFLLVTVKPTTDENMEIFNNKKNLMFWLFNCFLKNHVWFWRWWLGLVSQALDLLCGRFISYSTAGYLGCYQPSLNSFSILGVKVYRSLYIPPPTHLPLSGKYQKSPLDCWSDSWITMRKV